MKFVALMMLKVNLQNFWEYKLKKLKKFDLLKVKEKLKMQESICDLNSVEADSQKCQTIQSELEQLLDEYNSKVDETAVNAFISNRRLMHKMLDQKEVLLNRLEFLENEKQSIIRQVAHSKVKSDTYHTRQAELKKRIKTERLKKNDDNFGQLKRQK